MRNTWLPAWAWVAGTADTALAIVDSRALERRQSACAESLWSWLAESERATLGGLVPSRCAERLAGRLAAKLAVHRSTGRTPWTVAVHLRNDAERRVHVEAWAVREAELVAKVSISHAAGYAAAVASLHRKVGLDLEEICVRHRGLAARIASAGWRQLLVTLQQDARLPPVTALIAVWTAREAALKFQGRGLVDFDRVVLHGWRGSTVDAVSWELPPPIVNESIVTGVLALERTFLQATIWVGSRYCLTLVEEPLPIRTAPHAQGLS